jgi:hypothetical protein
VEIFETSDLALAWIIEQVQDDEDIFLPPAVVLGGVDAFRRR